MYPVFFPGIFSHIKTFIHTVYILFTPKMVLINPKSAYSSKTSSLHSNRTLSQTHLTFTLHTPVWPFTPLCLPWMVSWGSGPLPRWWWWCVYRISWACIYTGRSRPSCPEPPLGWASGRRPDSWPSGRLCRPSWRPLWILSTCSGPRLSSPDRDHRLSPE